MRELVSGIIGLVVITVVVWLVGGFSMDTLYGIIAILVIIGLISFFSEFGQAIFDNIRGKR